jgi:DNA-binding Lrp family transcriptional regulator
VGVQVTARSYRRRPVLAETVLACRPVEAIARVRLAPDKPCLAFERQLGAIPAVLSAVHVTGDVDYELRLACRDVADLGAVLTSLRGCGGTEVASTALVLREVAGLGQSGPAIPNGVTVPRLRRTLSACPALPPVSGPAVRAWSPTARSRSAACG